MGRGPPLPGCCGGGRGGVRPRGWWAPRDPARRLPPSLDLPFLPHLGSRKPETLARRGPRQVVALGGLPRAGAREGIRFPFLRPSESRLASGGSAAAVAFSLPAVWLAAARPSPPPVRPRGLQGAGRRESEGRAGPKPEVGRGSRSARKARKCDRHGGTGPRWPRAPRGGGSAEAVHREV